MFTVFIFPSENIQDMRKEHVARFTMAELDLLGLKAEDIIFNPRWGYWYICNEANEAGQITIRHVEINEPWKSKDVKRITPEMKTAALLLKD